MFCDLVGSTALASRLDAEDWRSLVNAYLDDARTNSRVSAREKQIADRREEAKRTGALSRQGCVTADVGR
jgi:hypothetical protein